MLGAEGFIGSDWRAKLSLKYYFQRFFWGALGFVLAAWNGSIFSHVLPVPPLIIDGFSALLFPCAIKFVENLALRFTSREFWNKGVLIDTPGKSGGYAIFYVFCYVFSIPLGMAYVLCDVLKPHKNMRL
ncbi:colicin E1 family microcin immunity protein [Pseudomonas sp. 5P_3.1_Bac2]|uniref:colicin E1 family microcin immunity protein n=1 Tax=Pseudomonas sp. 5P_3.1_Bac2 TaxID=2971617 RepID=UPI003965A43C